MNLHSGSVPFSVLGCRLLLATAAMIAIVVVTGTANAVESARRVMMMTSAQTPPHHSISLHQPMIAFQMPESGFSLRFKAFDRSSKQVHEGTAIRYKNEKTESMNVILESGVLGLMTFFDTRNLHVFMKPVQEGGVEVSSQTTDKSSVTQCIHINYDAPWNAFDSGIGLSKMLNQVTFKAVTPKSVIFDKEVNAHCVNNKLDMYSFSFMDESMVLCANGSIPVFIISKSLVVSMSEFTLTKEKADTSSQPTLHEKLFLDQMDRLVSNCTYYDRKYLAEYFGKKNIHAKQDTTTRDRIEKYLTRYRVSLKYGLSLPIIDEKAFDPSTFPSISSHRKNNEVSSVSLWFLNEQESCSSRHLRDEQSCVSYLTRKVSSGASQNKPTCIFLHGAGK